MKISKAIGTVLLCFLLLIGAALALCAGLFRFLVLNPDYYKAFVPSSDYCEEMRTNISANLDHIAIQYGLEEGSLKDVVTDTELTAYTRALIDGLFDSGTTDSLALPVYPKESFSEYLKAHTAYSEQAATDFAEDCAASVTEDLSSVNLDLLVSGFSRLRGSRLALLSPIVCIASSVLVIVLCAMAATLHSDTHSTGAICIFGGLFMGISTVLVPLVVFWLFDYIGRLNLAVSVFRTVLIRIFSCALYGCLSVLFLLLGVSFMMLLLSCISAARGKARKKKQA